MATKLKNLQLTSVDLVRAGANQEADICLYKSADPQEAAEMPSEREHNLFKRFINWLKETPSEAENEPQNPIEKEDTSEESADFYKSALTESILSIVGDETLTAEEKGLMVEKSIAQYHIKIDELREKDTEEEVEKEEAEEDDAEVKEVAESAQFDEIEEVEKSDHDDEIEEVGKSEQFDVIEEVQKYNHNHDALGRFSSGPGGGGSGGVVTSFGNQSRTGTAGTSGRSTSTSTSGRGGTSASDPKAGFVSDKIASEKVAKAQAQEPKLTSMLNDSAKEVGGEMVGLDFAVKSRESLSRKIKSEAKEKGITLEEAAGNMKDVNRYTMQLKEDNFVSGYNKTVKNLQSQGYEIVRVKNSLQNPNAPYRGVNTNVKSPDGSIWELQFHTKTSLDIKEVNHKLYEKQRLDDTPASQKVALGEEMARNAAAIPTPPGIENIKNIDKLK